jgi:DNA-binding NtrC family response regulator
MRVLAIDENPRIRDLVRDFLDEAGYQVLTAGSYRDAKTVLESGRVSLVVSEIQESQQRQEEFSRCLRQHPGVCLILHTAWPGCVETPLDRVDDIRMEKRADLQPLLESVERMLGCPSSTPRSA